MKYIVELRTSRRYVEIEANSPLAAIQVIKEHPETKHTHVEEHGEVFVEERGQSITVLTVYTPRRWDLEAPPLMGDVPMNPAGGSIA